MSVRLNLGCGTDIRDGWTNADACTFEGAILCEMSNLGAHNGSLRMLEMGLGLDPGAYLRVEDGACDTVLINHALHQLSYDDADLALAEAWRVLAPGGRLVIVEADVLGVLGNWDERREIVTAIVPETVEPTIEGRLLRWANWFGERRSLWSGDMLTCRPQFAGAWEVAVHWSGPTFNEWVGNRGPESFVFIATK